MSTSEGVTLYSVRERVWTLRCDLYWHGFHESDDAVLEQADAALAVYRDLSTLIERAGLHEPQS